MRRKRRRSPYRHRVRSHSRRSPKGRRIRVREYWRGRGEPPRRPPRRRASSPSPYLVLITYPDGRRERLTVEAPSYIAALERGLLMRGGGTPMMVEVERR